MKKYQIHITDEQATILCAALDLYARVGIGQFNIIEELYRFDERKTRHGQDIDLDKMRELMDATKALIGHVRGSSWGMSDPNVPDKFRIAYDLNQVLRHERWQQNGNPQHYSVDSHTRQTSKVPMAIATCLESDGKINQCDGCRRGLPIVGTTHRDDNPTNNQVCTKDRYLHPEKE